MIAQRVYGLALGYEDLNDHDQLREDPLLAVLSGRQRIGDEPLAGKSTLNRLELGGKEPTRYKKIHYHQQAIDGLLVKIFLEAHEKAPEEMVLDLDTTDLPLHGHQEGRFFHGYYDSYCYLPLYIFSGEHLLCARLHGLNDQPARVFAEFFYQTTTGSWSCSRRVVAKAEQLEGKENPRFIVTNLSSEQWSAQRLYEKLYCERAKVWLSMASSYPLQRLFGQVCEKLRGAVPLPE